MAKPWTVAIVGRTNVGKSTLFNRLSSDVKSLMLNYAGVTRDIVKDYVEWHNKRFELVDTGGIDLRKMVDEITQKVREQVFSVLESAHIILFVIDGTVGVVAEDREISNFLHALTKADPQKKVIVAINKADSAQSQEYIHEAQSLGYSDIVLISAQHGTGIDDLLEKIVDFLPGQTPSFDKEAAYKIMLLGRPNVGKSSLMNILVSEERSIVSAEPGTTREAITEPISFYKEQIALTDTPGIRRKRAVATDLETMMVKSSFQALKDSDIVLLLIDATEGALADQDLKLAFYAFTQQYKALVILINKFDIVTQEHIEELERSLDYYKHLIEKVPVLRISCKTGKNVGRVLPLISEVWKRYSRQYSESELTLLLVSALRKKPLVRAQQVLRLYKAYQIKFAPLTIVLEVNEPRWFQETQVAFFENVLRKTYDLQGTPIRFIPRKKKAAAETSRDSED